MYPASSRAELHRRVHAVARTLEVDRLALTVVNALLDAGIVTLVLKGPSHSSWLYPGEVRTYRDCDIMLGPRDREHAGAVLRSMGFRASRRARLAQSLHGNPGGTHFARERCVVDLHSTIPGLRDDQEVVWGDLLSRSKPLALAGGHVRAMDRDSALMHISLHAAQHATELQIRAPRGQATPLGASRRWRPAAPAEILQCKPFEDLRRALRRATDGQWCGALALARLHDGGEAFAAGLWTTPEGAALAHRLGLDCPPALHLKRLHREEALLDSLDAWLSSRQTPGGRLRSALATLFPRPEYMRVWWGPLAQCGSLGLCAAYAFRIRWAIAEAPGVALELRRRRGERRRRIPEGG